MESSPPGLEFWEELALNAGTGASPIPPWPLETVALRVFAPIVATGLEVDEMARGRRPLSSLDDHP